MSEVADTANLCKLNGCSCFAVYASARLLIGGQQVPEINSQYAKRVWAHALLRHSLSRAFADGVVKNVHSAGSSCALQQLLHLGVISSCNLHITVGLC